MKHSFISGTLPNQCYNYSILSDTYRNYASTYGCCWGPYDNVISSAWYRITSSAGSQLLTTTLSSTSDCGASFPGYYTGIFPTTAGSVVTGSVCFYTGVTCGYTISNIQVTNCNLYYVFYLKPTGSTSYKYCTI